MGRRHFRLATRRAQNRLVMKASLARNRGLDCEKLRENRSCTGISLKRGLAVSHPGRCRPRCLKPGSRTAVQVRIRGPSCATRAVRNDPTIAGLDFLGLSARRFIVAVCFFDLSASSVLFSFLSTMPTHLCLVLEHHILFCRSIFVVQRWQAARRMAEVLLLAWLGLAEVTARVQRRF